MLKEFELISRYFSARGRVREDVVLGVGDDSALVTVAPHRELAIAVDTLVAGVHFPTQTSAYDIAYKALAVNLSDMAAMGAEPAWATLALTLPDTDAEWLSSFAEGFFSLADSHGVQLIGGDTTRGPLTVTVQIHGLVDSGRALRRSGARPGDLIFVTGSLGDAALALGKLQAGEAVSEALLARLNRPTPRLEVGRRLLGLASAAIDISDGLLADLSHILDSSRCGAAVQLEELPMSQEYRSLMKGDARYYSLAASGGDDYELCFTAPAESRVALQLIADECGCPINVIGSIASGTGLHCYDRNGKEIQMAQLGYQHFNAGDK